MQDSSQDETPRGQGARPKEKLAGEANHMVSYRHSDGCHYFKLFFISRLGLCLAH